MPKAKKVQQEVEQQEQQQEPSEDGFIPEMPNSSFPDEVPFTVVPRSAWGARPPLDASAMHMPIRKVRFTYEDLSKYDPQLTASLQKCQQHYMEEKQYPDIPYNFLVTDGGLIFEGRGWTTSPESAGTKGDCLDIAFIGDFSGEHNPPTFDMCDASLSFIKYGIREELVHPHYETIPIISDRRNLTRKQKYFF